MKKILFQTLPFFFLFAGCEIFFQDRVPMNTGGPVSLADFFGREVKPPDQLAAPSQAYASDGQFAQEIRLTWNAVEWAASYAIERAVVAAGETPSPEDFDLLEQFVSGTSYTDHLKPAAPFDGGEDSGADIYSAGYYYRIIAENAVKSIEPSVPSAPVKGSLLGPPEQVDAIFIRYDTGHVKISWKKSFGAVRYEIRRSRKVDDSGEQNSVADDPYPRTIEVPGNQDFALFPVLNIEKYTYEVKARSALQGESVYSSPDDAKAWDLTDKEAPGNVSLAAGSGLGASTDSIRISWDPIEGDDIRYRVYRYSSVNSTPRLLSTTSSTSYEDTKQLEPGVYYYYKIWAVEPDGKEGLEPEYENHVKAFILSPPDTIIVDKNGNNTVSLKWLPAINVVSGDEKFAGIAPAVYSYRIFSSSEKDGTYTPIGLISGSPGADGYFHADNLALQPFYRIQTINSVNAAESSLSVPSAPAPAPALIQDASKAANIAGQTANTNGVYQVEITWKKPAAETPYAYHIYRSSSPDTGYRKITSDPVYAGTGEEFSFVDTANLTARPGKRFYYKVLSLNQLGQGNNYSDYRVGYGALTYEQYMLEFNKTVKSSHQKLTYINKPGATDKLGTETKNGTISGTVYYNAVIAGWGARVTIRYENYADFYADGDIALGPYFVLTGNSNSSASMDQSGTMDGTITASGMYPGKVYYDNVQIKSGAAGGGTYGIEPAGFPRSEISWIIGER
jgi:hypothetical protein